MAFDDAEQLLLAIGVDLTPIKQSAAEIQGVFSNTAKAVAVTIDNILKGIGQTGLQAASDFSSLTQVQIHTLEQLKSSVQETINAVKLSLVEETKKTGAIQEQVELFQKQIQLQKESYTQTVQATQATKQESTAREAAQKEKVDALNREVDLVRQTLALNQRLTAELEKQVALMGRTPSKIPATPSIAGETPTATPTFLPTEEVQGKPKASAATLLATAEAAEIALLQEEKQKEAGGEGGEHKKIGELLSDKSSEKQMDELVESVKKAATQPREAITSEPKVVAGKITTVPVALHEEDAKRITAANELIGKLHEQKLTYDEQVHVLEKALQLTKDRITAEATTKANIPVISSTTTGPHVASTAPITATEQLLTVGEKIDRQTRAPNPGVPKEPEPAILAPNIHLAPAETPIITTQAPDVHVPAAEAPKVHVTTPAADTPIIRIPVIPAVEPPIIHVASTAPIIHETPSIQREVIREAVPSIVQLPSTAKEGIVPLSPGVLELEKQRLGIAQQLLEKFEAQKVPLQEQLVLVEKALLLERERAILPAAHTVPVVPSIEPIVPTTRPAEITRTSIPPAVIPEAIPVSKSVEPIRLTTEPIRPVILPVEPAIKIPAEPIIPHISLPGPVVIPSPVSEPVRIHAIAPEPVKILSTIPEPVHISTEVGKPVVPSAVAEAIHVSAESIKPVILPVEPPIHIPAEPIRPVVLPVETAIHIPVEPVVAKAPAVPDSIHTSVPIAPVVPSPVVAPIIGQSEQLVSVEKQLAEYRQQNVVLEQKLALLLEQRQAQAAVLPIAEKVLGVEKLQTDEIRKRVDLLKAHVTQQIQGEKPQVEEEKSSKPKSAKQEKAELNELTEILEKRQEITREATKLVNLQEKSGRDQIVVISQAKAAYAEAVHQAKASEQIEAGKLKTIQAELEVLKGSFAAGKISSEAAETQAAALQKAATEQVNLSTAVQAEKNARIAVTKQILDGEISAANGIKAEIAETRSLLKERQGETREIEKQSAEIRRRLAEEKEEGGLLHEISHAIFGGGLAGGLIKGIIGGTFFASAITSIGTEVAHLIEKLKEASVEGGRITLMSDNLEKLAKGSGQDAGKMMDQLREKTEGLVGKQQLLKLAIDELNSHTKMSTERFAEMAGGLVKLGEVRNIPATQTIAQLDRALVMGRPAVLAMVSGLDSLRLISRDIAPAMRGTTAATEAMWTKTAELVKKQADAVGQLPLTIEQVQERLKGALNNLFTDFAIGFNTSPGMQEFLKVLSEIGISLQDKEAIAKRIGRTVGDAFTLGVPIIRVFQGVMTELWEVVKSVTRYLGELFDTPAQKEGAVKGALKVIAELFLQIGAVVQTVIASVHVLINSISDMKPAVADILDYQQAAFKLLADSTSFNPLKNNPATLFLDKRDLDAAGDKFVKDFKTVAGTIKERIGSEFNRIYGKEGFVKNEKEAFGAIDASQGKDIDHSGYTSAKVEGELTIQDQIKQARELMQMQQSLAKLLLTERQSEIQDAKQLDQEAYQSGEEALTQHFARQKQIALDAHQARLDDLEVEHQATLQNIQADLALGAIKPYEAKAKTGLEELQYGRKVLGENRKVETELYQLRRQAANDEQSARIKEIQERERLETEAVQNEAKLRDKQFTAGEIKPESYVQAEIADVENLTRIQIQAATDTYLAQADKLTARQEFEFKVQEAIAKGEEKLATIREAAIDKYLNNLEKVYAPRQRAMEEQIQFQQELGPANNQAFGASTSSVIKDLQGNLEEQRLQYEAAINSSLVTKGSEQWFEIYNRIQSIYHTQVQWKDELQKTLDLTHPLGDALGSLAESMGQVFTSKIVQNIADVLQSGARQLSQAKEVHDRIFGKGVPKKSEAMLELEKEAREMFSAVTISTSELETPFKSLADTVLQVQLRFADLLSTADQVKREKAAGLPVLSQDQLYSPDYTRQLMTRAGFSGYTPEPITGPGLITPDVRSQLLPTQAEIDAKNSEQAFQKVLASIKETGKAPEEADIRSILPLIQQILHPGTILPVEVARPAVELPEAPNVATKLESLPTGTAFPQLTPAPPFQPVPKPQPLSEFLGLAGVGPAAGLLSLSKDLASILALQSSKPVGSKPQLNEFLGLAGAGPSVGILSLAKSFVDVLIQQLPLQAKIAASAQKAQVPVSIAQAVAHQESRTRQFDKSGKVITSSAGAQGVMQLMPSTAAKLGVNPLDAQENIEGGNRLLAILAKKYGDDWTKVLEAYNWGEGKLDKALAATEKAKATGKPIPEEGLIPHQVQQYAAEVQTHAAAISLARGAVTPSAETTTVPASPQSTVERSVSALVPSVTVNVDSIAPILQQILDLIRQMTTLLGQIYAEIGGSSSLLPENKLPGALPQAAGVAFDLQLPKAPPFLGTTVTTAATVASTAPTAATTDHTGYGYDPSINIQINEKLIHSGNALAQVFDKIRNAVVGAENKIGGLFQKKTAAIAVGDENKTAPIQPNIFGLLGDEFKAVFKGGKGKFGTGQDEEGNTTYGSAGEALGAFTTSLTAAVGGIASFVQTLTSAKSPIAGALGGAAGGAGLTKSLGLDKIPVIGQFAGVIGAGVGAILGGIMGEKNRQVQRNLDNATAKFKIIMGDFALNNNNLQQTVVAIQGIISQLQYEKSQSKKGGSQFDQAIQQYRDQLQQLQTQQTQLMISLYQQVSVLSAPQGMQDTLSTLQQMLKQYEQFVGAARDTNDLAEANHFLADSLSNLENNALQQFNQNETQAIQDALQLNDLLYQRQDLIRQYNNQVQGILSQGVLTRQLTMAQSKGQQIEKLSADYQRQQEQMNEQISVQQYRVQAESHIFQLATTRTTLEMQLATVQKQAVDADMLRISALTQLVHAFQTGDWNFKPIQDIITAINMQGVSNPSVGVGNGSLFGGGNLNSALAGALDALISGAYQDRSISGYATYRGQGL